MLITSQPPPPSGRVFESRNLFSRPIRCIQNFEELFSKIKILALMSAQNEGIIDE
jgi:hypothetical protein